MRQIHSRFNPFKCTTLEARLTEDRETARRPKETGQPKERLEVRCDPPLPVRGYSNTVAGGR